MSEPSPGEGSETAESKRARLRVRNIGGIDTCSVTLRSSVTVLTGRNATNRTSFLESLADILGGPSAALKSDADDGSIELEFDGTTYSRSYSRNNGTLVTQGTQFTDRGDIVELFVRILEDNPARRVVQRGGDLHEVIMDPVDTDDIEQEIRERERERNRLDDRLEEVEAERKRLPELERRRNRLETDIDELTEEIASVEASLQEFEANKEETERAEELVDELDSIRQSLRETEDKIADREAEIERLEGNLAEVEVELEETSVPEAELEHVESELDRLRQRRRDLESAVDDLQRIVSFNEELLAGDVDGLVADSDVSDVTAELDPSAKTITCWTCGSAVQRDVIDERLDELRNLVSERHQTVQDVESDIADLTDTRSDLRRKRDGKREMENQRDRLQRQIEFQRDELDDLRTDREELRSELDELKRRAEETADLRETDQLQRYQDLSEMEYERGQLENELERVEGEISDIESLADEREELTARREALSEELSSLRSRIDELESQAVEQFNGHMESLITRLDYNNLERVWIERRASENETESAFDLHIVRESVSETVYEDTVDNLSESERELIGLVVALAGYLVHDVYEDVPFMLLDSLEAIDSDRIATLVDYFASYAPFLVVALLPADAAALDDSYDRVTPEALSSGR